MQVRPIDPRDTDIEVDSPTYRVCFWERQETNESSTPGFTSFEYEIADTLDVHEMLHWAEANAGDRAFTTYVVVDKTLVRLSGQDPTAAQ
jgi:hypothetical protein